METPWNAIEAPLATKDKTDTSSGERGSKRSEEQDLKEGFGTDKEFKVPWLNLVFACWIFNMTPFL